MPAIVKNISGKILHIAIAEKYKEKMEVKKMKKNILKATLVVAFALIAGMNVYNAQQSDVMSDLRCV